MAGEQMPPEAAAQAQQPQGGMQELVVNTNDALQTLAQNLDQAGALSQEGQVQIGNIISEFQDFVQSELLGEGAAEQAPAPGGVAPEMAGGANVKPAL